MKILPCAYSILQEPRIPAVQVEANYRYPTADSPDDTRDCEDFYLIFISDVIDLALADS